jgi:hypothetical protein
VSRLLVVLAAVLLLGATVTAYLDRTLFDSDRFADHAAAAVRDDRVRTAVADKVTDDLVLRTEPDLVAARPLIAAAVSGVVAGEAFTRLFAAAVRDAHRATFSRDQNTVTLTVFDVGTVVATALRKLQPDLADEIERRGRVELLSERIGSVTGDLTRTADRFRALAVVLSLLAVASAAGAVALSRDRRRTVTQLGIGAIAAGVAIAIAYLAVRSTLDDVPRAVWEQFLGDLFAWALLLAALGAIVAAAASSLIGPGALDGMFRRIAALVTAEPRTQAWRAVRAVALVAVGGVMIVSPLLVLQVATVLAGIVLVYAGIDALLRLVHRPRPAAPPRRPRRWLAYGVAAALAVAVVAVFTAGGGVSEPRAAAPVERCNGHAELCDRTLADVVLPATHNSMSAPLPGWFSTMQERPIGGQLADGIRGLLIDTHYADKLRNGRVRTQLGGPDDIPRLVADDAVSQSSIDAALRLRDRLGFQGEGERGIYLCHSFCEIGATPLSDGLRDIHDFLVTNPDEVVVVVNQDYIPAADYVRAVREAGLEPYVAALDPARLPTLRQMIESGHRLVLLAENHAGGAPWYELAYDRMLEETPYHFPTAKSLIGDPAKTCAANRGPAGAPLFLLNHWVTTDPVPRPSDADVVNAYEPLLARARTCGQIRRHAMNLLAVNFYKRGDVFKVADTLNGVAAASVK